MLSLLRRLIALLKSRRQVDAAIANLSGSPTTNRTPLDPDNDPWRS